MMNDPEIHTDSSVDEGVESTGDSRIFPCVKCGGKLAYAPGTANLTCPYCGTDNAIDLTERAVLELDYHEHLAQIAQATDHDEHQTISCKSCGIELDRPETLDAFRCPYCGSDLIGLESSIRLIRPRSLLPFHITRQQALGSFRRWVKGLWFAPNDLKRFPKSPDRLNGIYIPYWTYDTRATTQYTGQRGEHYWVTETYTTTVNGKQVTRTRQVRKTRWYPAWGTVQNAFDDVLVLASRSLPHKHAHALEPWDIANLVPYQSDFLAGFRAERYQIELDDGFEQAQALMQSTIDASIRSDIGGDEQQIHSKDTRYDEITFKHILLPVWISAYRFKGRVFRILVNARTGEVQGERPYSAWKIAMAVIAAVVAVLVVVMIVALNR